MSAASVAWALPIAVLAALVLVGAVGPGRRRGLLRVRGTLVAALTAPAALAVGTLPAAALLVPFAPQVFLVDGVAHGSAVAAFTLCGGACVPVLGTGTHARDVSRT